VGQGAQVRRGVLDAAHPQAVSAERDRTRLACADQVPGDRTPAMRGMASQPTCFQPPPAQLTGPWPGARVPQPGHAHDPAVPLRHQAGHERLQTEPGEDRRLIARRQERQVVRVRGDAGGVDSGQPRMSSGSASRITAFLVQLMVAPW
jgi:hypothetical protein